MQPTDESQSNWRPIALGLACLAVLVALLRLLPEEMKPTNLTPIGALALFAGARLRGWQSYAIPLVLMIVTDTVMYFAYDYPPFDPFVYASYAAYITLAALALRRSESPWRIGGVLVVSSSIFFLLTNFGAWLMKALPYPDSFGGLLMAYENGVPFHRSFLVGDVIFSALLFGAFAVLTRTVDSPERIRSSEVMA